MHVPIESATRKGLYGRPAVDAVNLVVMPGEKLVVIRIFEMYAGGLGFRAIATTLNQENIPSPLKGTDQKRRFWNADNVKGILNNEKYRGVNVWNRTRVVRNPMTQKKEQHPRPESERVRVEVPNWRMVTDEQWAAVVAANKDRQGASWWKEGGLNRSEASRRYIFSGLMTCAECGGNVSIVGGEKGSNRYGCIGHRYRGNCSNALTILLRRLEEQMMEAMTRAISDPEVREQLYRDFEEQQLAGRDERESAAQRATSTVEELSCKKIDLRKQADNLLDSIQDVGRSPFLSERLNRLEVEMRNTEDLLLAHTAVNTEPLPPDGIRELIDRKLAELAGLLSGTPEVAKPRLRKYVDKLTMTALGSEKDAKYMATGVIRVFASDDPEGVLLAGSLQRSCKQYISLSFPFEAIMNARTAKGRNRSKSDGRYVKTK
jgi:site-specific DNA recombinase